MNANRPARRHRGALLLTLGLLLMLSGGFVLLTTPDLLVYILPAPAATTEGGELSALYEQGEEQLAAIADSFTAHAIGARAQGQNVSAGETKSVTATVYAVGAGYFDVVHETLAGGRLISETDVSRAQNVLVIEERAALTLFPGENPIGSEVSLAGETYEVVGVIRAGRRIGEVDGYVAYMPITAASRNALGMNTVECVAKGTDAVASAILMRDTLSSWQGGGSFYSLPKLKLGAVMPLRWVILAAGVLVLLGLLRRLNAVAWKRICGYAEALQTRYARTMLGGMAASFLLCAAGYAALLALTWALASFSIQPLYVFTEWVPEVIVEISSLTSRFWSLNAQNAAAMRLVGRDVCRVELGQGLLRWGLMAALLGLAFHGIPWLNRVIELPRMKRER